MTLYRVKPHRLTFRLEHLEPVLSGEKRATIRFSAVAQHVASGDVLTLAFGRYDRPKALEAICTRVETVDLEADLRRCHTVPGYVTNLLEERRWREQPKRPDEDTPVALLEALWGSGGDYEAVLDEAAAREADTACCIWFELKN